MGTAVTKFYTFRQNNSGGSFEIDDKSGLSICVVVEAIDANHANARAADLGLYFDGVCNGMDCGCCGDRWSSVTEWDGAEVPSHYGQAITDRQHEKDTWDWTKGGIYFFVHYLNGKIEGYKHNGEKVA